MPDDNCFYDEFIHTDSCREQWDDFWADCGKEFLAVCLDAVVKLATVNPVVLQANATDIEPYSVPDYACFSDNYGAIGDCAEQWADFWSDCGDKWTYVCMDTAIRFSQDVSLKRKNVLAETHSVPDDACFSDNFGEIGDCTE